MQLSPEKIKHFRKENGWSQDLLAQAAGLSLRTVQRIEKDGNASMETQMALAAALDQPLPMLCHVSDKIEVLWKWRSMMQGLLAIATVIAAIIMLITLGGDLGMFSDLYSGIYVLAFMYSATAIAFGGQGLVKSMFGFKYLFSSEIAMSEGTRYLSTIYKKQIYFVYGGALVATIIGLIAILSHYHEVVADGSLQAAYAVCLLILLYAGIIAEGILRPLSIKLEQSSSVSR
ncbi:helix-turn-helix domain-containing protein [Colwellia sp. MEBiC06753]